MSCVLDTSVLLATGKNVFHSPEFQGEELVIPLVVVRELESKRSDYDLGLSARSVLRFLEELRTRGDLNKGVQVANGPIVRIEVNHISTELPAVLRVSDSADVRILSVAKALDAVLVTRDLPLRLVASTAGVQTQDYVPSAMNVYDDHDKIRAFTLDSSDQESFFAGRMVRTDAELPVNANLIVNGNGLAVSKPNWGIQKISDHSIKGIEGRNAEQRFAMDHLMNPDVTMVSLGGRAGSGKTMLALAAGIDQVERGIYDRVVVFRSIHEVGFKDLGSLPGTIDEKFGPFTEAVFDATDAFMTRPNAKALVTKNVLEILPINYVRGRTFNRAFILIDEAQNLEYSSLVTLLTRVGRGSKIVLASDISQSDNLHVSKHSGITEVVRKLYGHKLFAHVHMTKSQRSETAETVANLLAI